MGFKKLVTLKEKHPNGEMNLGSFRFKYLRPKAVHFKTDEWMLLKKHDSAAMEKFFRIEDFDGELPEGGSIENGSEKAIEGAKSDNELDAILKGGDPKQLAAYIEKNGRISVKAEILKQVLTSLNIEFHGNNSQEKLAEKLIEYSKKA